jgi:hypothetical protein
MMVYWSFVLVPTLLSLSETMRRNRRGTSALLALIFVFLFFFMGLRETAGDYPTYVNLYEVLAGADLETSLSSVEPLYGLLNWISSHLGLGLYGVNSICALVFLYCLARVASAERLPLLLTTLAIPYFVIVVGMGYTRQGVAAALVMLSIVQLRQNRVMLACLTILAGTGFHYSAFAAMALPLFVRTRNQTGVRWFVSRLAVVGIIAISAQSFLSDRIDTYVASYIEIDRYESGGAFLRSLVTAAAGVAFFAWRKEFKRLYSDYVLWRPFALVALVCPPLSFVASTPVDRMGLYLLPFQIITFSRMPVVVNGGRSALAAKTVILCGYLLYFYTWLHLGAYAGELWLPYRWIFS